MLDIFIRKIVFSTPLYLDSQIRGKYTIQSTPPHESDDENEPTPPHENEYEEYADEENENSMLYKIFNSRTLNLT